MGRNLVTTLSSELKANDQDNLFVIFGEPDIEAREENDGQLRVKIRNIDIFDPTTGEIRSDKPDRASPAGCWIRITITKVSSSANALLPRPEHPQARR
jgi:hypothetical protein